LFWLITTLRENISIVASVLSHNDILHMSTLFADFQKRIVLS
jgi:hypothetical protein